MKIETFFVKIQDTFSDICNIEAGVPQGSVLGPVLYILYTADIPSTYETSIFTFADDIVSLATHDDPKIAHNMLRQHLKIEHVEMFKNGVEIK